MSSLKLLNTPEKGTINVREEKRKFGREQRLLSASESYAVYLALCSDLDQYDIESVLSRIIFQKNINLKQLQFQLQVEKMSPKVIREIILLAKKNHLLKLKWHSDDDNCDIMIDFTK